MNALAFWSEVTAWVLSHIHDADMLIQSVLTCGAFLWLLQRAWQTLWKPVPELISILGVEVPEPPEVSLAEIKGDAVTLHWTRPGSSKPVTKHVIQVNGVDIGHTNGRELAITVTGLRPAHFYNVRVIAVGGNNTFQAASPVIRLRTYGKDGRPELGNGRIPANFSIEDVQEGTVVDSSDEGASLHPHNAGVEVTTTESAPPMVREVSNGLLSQRRNTVGRRHSPSTASDNPPSSIKDDTDESMQQLTERFEAVRIETDSIAGQITKEREDFDLQLAELTKEREERKVALKEKEEASEKLKREVHNSERINRAAQNRKTTKEKALREKEAERNKIQDDMARWEHEIQDMQLEAQKWQAERGEIEAATERKMEEMRDILRKRQNSLNGMEEELRIKGLQLRELEDERTGLPGAEEDEEAKERDLAERQRDFAWEQRERELQVTFNNKIASLRITNQNLDGARHYQNFLMANQQNNVPDFGYNGSNTVGLEHDPSGLQRARSSRRGRQRKSRTNTMSSPAAGSEMSDSSFPGGYSAFNPVSSPRSFAPGPYIDLNTNTSLHSRDGSISDPDMRALTGGAPLSPTATSLLPTGLFMDDEPPSPGAMSRALGPSLFDGDGNDYLDSAESSEHSGSHFSSPHMAVNAIPTATQALENDSQARSSPKARFGVIGSPNQPNIVLAQAPKRSLQDRFFSRSREKSASDGGPALGSLKAGQSHSFPRQLDESEPILLRNRRTSFSTGWSAFLHRSQTDAIDGNAPALARNGPIRRKGFKILGSSVDDPTAIFSDRDPSSPRPASIASSDLPRPSMDSNPFGWPVGGEPINRNSPLATNWSISPTYAARESPVRPPGFEHSQSQTGYNHPWGTIHTSSRRPSIQHASSSALANTATLSSITNNVASEDDEILLDPPFDPQASPPSLGPIGSGARPQSSKSQNPVSLNPNAQPFRLIFGRTRAEKNKQAVMLNNENDDMSQKSPDEASSPTMSRRSKDQRSILSQASISESFDSLDRSDSNDPTSSLSSSHPKGESTISKLIRKGSSSFVGSLRVASSKSRINTPDVDEHGEDDLARSWGSVASSPMAASASGSNVGTPRKPGIMSRFSMSGKAKSKEKVRDVGERAAERSLTSGAETTEDEKEE